MTKLESFLLNEGGRLQPLRYNLFSSPLFLPRAHFWLSALELTRCTRTTMLL